MALLLVSSGLAFTLLSSCVSCIISNPSTDVSVLAQVGSVANNTINNKTYTNKYCRHLYELCICTIYNLQNLPLSILNSVRGKRLIQHLRECLIWCEKYQRKGKLKKLIFTGSDMDKIKKLRLDLNELYYFLLLESIYNNMRDKGRHKHKHKHNKSRKSKNSNLFLSR